MHFKKSFQQYQEKKKTEMTASTELERLFMGLSPTEVQSLLSKYETTHNIKIPPSPQPPTDRFADFVEQGDFQIVCPDCKGTVLYKHGSTANGKPRYRCNACNKTFTPFAGTLVQGSSLSWEVWVELVYCVLNSKSLVDIRRELDQDFGISMTEGTILSYKHKIQKAITLCYPMPKLSGVVQVDETFFREGQKGSRNLVNVAPTAIEKRIARTQKYAIPAKLGINSPEFACVVTGRDSSGHVAAVVTGLGKSTAQPFEEYFAEYLGDVTFLCSDGFEAYRRYTEMQTIPHYVKMSEFDNIINKERKAFKERHKVDTTKSEIQRRLYGTRQLDYIDNYADLTFDKFDELKDSKGLTLDNINNFHRQLKRRINKDMSGVSTIYLPLYIGQYVFMRNWSIDHNDKPVSRKDAEQIFTDLLLAGGNFVSRGDLEKQSILNFSKPTTKYINYLKDLTDNIRTQSEQMGFTIDENDRLIRFNKRKYFENAPKSRLKEIGKEYKIKGYTRMSVYQLAREICALPNVNDIFLRLVASDNVHAPYTDDLLLLLQQAEQDG